jgi:hypothetical protein
VDRTDAFLRFRRLSLLPEPSFLHAPFLGVNESVRHLIFYFVLVIAQAVSSSKCSSESILVIGIQPGYFCRLFPTQCKIISVQPPMIDGYYEVFAGGSFFNPPLTPKIEKDSSLCSE